MRGKLLRKRRRFITPNAARLLRFLVPPGPLSSQDEMENGRKARARFDQPWTRRIVSTRNLWSRLISGLRLRMRRKKRKLFCMFTNAV